MGAARYQKYIPRMHVVVTGAAGFIGSHTCERLVAQGHRVTGLDSFDGYLYPPEVKEGGEVVAWAGTELAKMGGLTRREITLGVLVVSFAESHAH